MINKKMAGAQSGAPSYLQGGNCNTTDNLPQEFKSGWYFSREDIENNSPSRKDGIVLQEEEQLRNSYCSFLQDLGRKLGASQVMIATATLFCHRFYLHQSHAKNDWQTVATVCIFLASKVEDTPILVDKVITASYEMIHRRDEAAPQKIRQKDVFSKQKALILLGERLVLSTIRFDFNIQHPYRPLIRAMNKFGLTQKAFRQMAWNYVNDWLRTTLCLQYKPHYIVAGTLFMTAKIQKVKLPSGKGYVWWHEFDVTPHQLDAVIREMMEFLGYKRKPVAAPKMPAQTPLPAKEEASSSPDSCVSSTPGSTHTVLGNDVDGEVGKSKQVDIVEAISSSCCNTDGEHDNVAARIGETQCPARDLENPNGVVDDGEHFNVANHATAQPDRVPDRRGKVNLEKIKLLLTRRKSLQKISNKTISVDDDSEDTWLERELEAGIDLAVDSSKKKPRLS